MIELRAGRTRLAIAPEAGGSIAAFDWDGGAVMRPSPDDAVAARDPLRLACFPLVPWSNRIARGRFDFGGRAVRLPPNAGDPVNTIHGQGWLRPWEVLAADTASARLGYEHEPDSWPWAYRAELDYTAHDDSIDVRLAVENRAAEPMPAGLGLHPYYPRTPGMTFHARLDGWWDTDAAIMPVAHRAVAPQTEWSAWLHAATTTDNVFSGWDGEAELVWPEKRLALTMTASDAAKWMVVYAPTDAAVAVVEPVTHPTDALNQPGLPGMHILAPGARLELRTSFRLRRL